MSAHTAAAAAADHPDTLIVGAGIAGLYIARELLKGGQKRVLVVEKYPVIGGRVLSFRKCLRGFDVPDDLVRSTCERSESSKGGVGGAQLPPLWEAGAGRLHFSQKRVHKLLEEYGMEVAPLPASADFLSATGRRQPNEFAKLAGMLLPPLADLPVADLQTNTLAEICKRVYGPTVTAALFEQFPYYTEVYSLRADEALATFRGVMGAEEGFCVVKGGLGQLAQALAADVRRRGGSIWTGTELIEFERSAAPLKALVRLHQGTRMPLYPAKLILALHVGALRKLRPSWPPLRHLGTAKLLRIYAIFPKDRGSGKPWFAGMPKTVCAGPLRYVIPISEDQGTIMISYTDGADAAPFWEAADGGNVPALTAHIMRLVRASFGRHIPNPTFLKAHPWTVGSTYWKPGNYDVDAVIAKSRIYGDGIYVCGESFSHDQAWIEGALESAEGLLQVL
jgi:hypothetical protein